jgi:hypothetical protein
MPAKPRPQFRLVARHARAIIPSDKLLFLRCKWRCRQFANTSSRMKASTSALICAVSQYRSSSAKCAVIDARGQMKQVPGHPTKRFHIPKGLNSLFQRPCH